MKNKSPLGNLVIRTAIVKRPDLGFVFCADLTKEEDDTPYTVVLKWKQGQFQQGDRNYDAHTACVIENPERGHVDVAGIGDYSVITLNGAVSGNILESSQPPPKELRFGGFESVSEIGGRAYAVGSCGMVYRLDKLEVWTRIDDGLPDDFDIEAIHGFNDSDLYTVGNKGVCWHYNGKKWDKCELPTNINLNEVKCAGNGKVYLGGEQGVLIQGSGNTWEIIEHKVTEGTIWDLEWFEEKLYVLTGGNVYYLDGNMLIPVDFGKDPPDTFDKLSAAPGVMWSIGSEDIMSFDGKKWTRVV